MDSGYQSRDMWYLMYLLQKYFEKSNNARPSAVVAWRNVSWKEKNADNTYLKRIMMDL